MSNKTINYKNPNMVEGFNPDDYKQYYSNGKAYLPFKIQLLWFRMVYPTGKLVVFRPEMTPMKDANTFIATARAYASSESSQDSYLSEASAMRGPDVKIEETGESIDPYNAAQVAAMSLALKLAGFWCGIDEDDLTRELEKAVTGDESAQETAEPKTEEKPAEAPKAEDKPAANKGKRGKKKEESKPVENPNTQSTQEVSETPVETAPETEVKEPEQKAEEVDEKAAEDKQETEQQVTAETAEATENAEQPAEEQKASEEEVKEEAKEEPQAEEETAEQAVTEEAKDEAENDAEDKKETAEQPEQQATTEQETPAPAAEEEKQDKTAEPPIVDEKELENLRSEMFCNGYFNDTIGVLEDKAIKEMESGEGTNDAFHLRLYRYLLTSPMAQGKTPKAAAAALRLAELVHKDWLEEWLPKDAKTGR